MKPERLLKSGAIISRLPEEEQAVLVQWLYERTGNQHVVAERTGLSLRQVRKLLGKHIKPPGLSARGFAMCDLRPAERGQAGSS